MAKKRKQAFGRFIPPGDTIVVRRIEPDEVTKGGILLPEEARQWRPTGIVLDLGPECNVIWKGKRPIEVGDMIWAGKYSFSDSGVEIDGLPALIIKAADVQGIQKPEKPHGTPKS